MCSELMNDIISTSAGGAAAGLVLYGVQHIHQAIIEKRDSRRVFNWLTQEGLRDGGYMFRSTRTIASYTNLTEDRVRYICSIHPDIYQSTSEKRTDLWGLDEERIRNYDNLPE